MVKSIHSFFSVFHLTVIPTYCNSATVPTLANANAPTPNQTVNSVTYFTCNPGYQSSGAIPPYFSCTAYNTTSGNWSDVTYSCQSKAYSYIYVQI